MSLGSDNHSSVHPKIMDAIVAANKGTAPSYGTDSISLEAIKKFKEHFGHSTSVFFVFNGTAANTVALKALLKPYQSVLCSENAHLHWDECGAPEALVGTKLVIVPSVNGKVSIEELEKHMIRLGDQHFIQPGVLSLTQPTELGTLYSYEELKNLIGWAKSNNLKVHIDGARYVHASTQLNLNFKQLGEELGVDIISFGGTKNGLMFGEAILCFDESLKKDLKFLRKQFLQLPSKSRYLAAQFLAFFDKDLWKELSEHSCSMARLLYDKLKVIPEVSIVAPVDCNAVFAKLPKEWIKPLKKHSFFYVWDEHDWTVRLMAGFDTKESDILSFANEVRALSLEKNPEKK